MYMYIFLEVEDIDTIFFPSPDRFSVAQSPVHTGPNDQIHTLILKNMQMVRSQFTRA